jgi:hypothetical protein
VLLRVLQEVDDLLEFGLGLVDAGDIGESDLGVGLDVDLGLALADGHEAAAEALLFGNLAENKHPQGEEDDDGQDPRQDVAQDGAEAAFRGAAILDAILLEFGGNVRIDARRHEFRCLSRLRALDGPGNVLVADDDVVDLALPQIGLKLAVGERLDLLILLPQRLQDEDTEDGGEHIPEVVLNFLVHLASLAHSGTRPVSASTQDCFRRPRRRISRVRARSRRRWSARRRRAESSA